MELTGKIIDILPAQEGEGKNGTWKKQNVIIEHGDKFPRKVCVTLWGELATQEKSCIGKEIEASLDLESRENNGRWYTEVKAWKFKMLCLLLFLTLFSCKGSSYKPYLGEWNKINSNKFIDRLTFKETEGKLLLIWMNQRVETYKGTEKQYSCDVDEQGNVIVHAELGDRKGKVLENKLYMGGDVYEKYTK